MDKSIAIGLCAMASALLSPIADAARKIVDVPTAQFKPGTCANGKTDLLGIQFTKVVLGKEDGWLKSDSEATIKIEATIRGDDKKKSGTDNFKSTVPLIFTANLTPFAKGAIGLGVQGTISEALQLNAEEVFVRAVELKTKIYIKKSETKLGKVADELIKLTLKPGLAGLGLSAVASEFGDVLKAAVNGDSSFDDNRMVLEGDIKLKVDRQGICADSPGVVYARRSAVGVIAKSTLTGNCLRDSSDRIGYASHVSDHRILVAEKVNGKCPAYEDSTKWTSLTDPYILYALTVEPSESKVVAALNIETGEDTSKHVAALQTQSSTLARAFSTLKENLGNLTAMIGGPGKVGGYSENTTTNTKAVKVLNSEMKTVEQHQKVVGKLSDNLTKLEQETRQKPYSTQSLEKMSDAELASLEWLHSVESARRKFNDPPVDVTALTGRERKNHLENERRELCENIRSREGICAGVGKLAPVAHSTDSAIDVESLR